MITIESLVEQGANVKLEVTPADLKMFAESIVQRTIMAQQEERDAAMKREAEETWLNTKQVRELLSVCEGTLNLWAKRGYLVPVKVGNKNIKALREALINSLCHRQWEKYNLTNSIAIYDDRIEIANPGIFPPQITPESIKKPHESYPYNLKIAEALYKSTYLESWGSGAKRIMDACREQGVEDPSWRCDGGFVIVTFKRPKYDSSTPQLGNQLGTNKEPARNQLETSSSQVKLLIAKMEESFYSVKDLINLFGLSDVRKFRKNYIQPALAEGAIERLYPDRPNHPKQKYRLTDLAKEWKKKNTDLK